jgi:hypothetical protein
LGIINARLFNQGMTGTGLESPEAAVKWLGAVQAQDFAGAKWSVGQRVQGCTEADVVQAYNTGRLLRTHILRPTWHFVAPADIRWMQQVTAPRVRNLQTHYDRRLELDRKVIGRCEAVFADALEGHKSLTRAELAERLRSAGVEASGQRLGHIVAHAELDLLICSGPMRGKQHTYMLLDERAPLTETLERDEALAQLALRFFTGHGPATLRDFTWWSSLTAAGAREGLAMVRERLDSEVVDGKTYWSAASSAARRKRPVFACLLPEFDESHIAYQDLRFEPVESGPERPAVRGARIERPVIVGGRFAGTWKRSVEKDMLVISARFFEPPDPGQKNAIMSAVERYGMFMGVPARLETVP